MEKKPLVSIVVPVYNTAKYLPTCLNSITNQTYQNLEIVIVNDGSTDDSINIISDYSKKDSRIKIIKQKNQGLSSARNTGINKSTGKYLTFVDSDDYIMPKMIEHMINAISKSNADIVCCSFKELYSNGKENGFNNKHKTNTYNTEGAIKAMLKEQGFMLSATMKLFPSKYFDDIKFPIGKLHEDVSTTYRLIMQANRITFIPNEDYVYVHHNSSIISKFNDAKFDLIKLTDKMCNDIDSRFPNLQNVTNERRIRARFSLLRQIPLDHPQKQSLIDYLKIHQAYITKNPEATRKDKIALKLALISPRLFQLAYKLFK